MVKYLLFLGVICKFLYALVIPGTFILISPVGVVLEKLPWFFVVTLFGL
jgi:hypothetical protein